MVNGFRDGFLTTFIWLFVYYNYNYTYFYRIIVFACISTFYELDRLGDLRSYTI